MTITPSSIVVFKKEAGHMEGSHVFCTCTQYISNIPLPSWKVPHVCNRSFQKYKIFWLFKKVTVASYELGESVIVIMCLLLGCIEVN